MRPFASLRRFFRSQTLTLLLLGSLSGLSASVRAEETVAIPGLGPIGRVGRIAADFQFTEGPAADAAGRLYFSDVTGNRIYRLSTEGRPEVFLDPSDRANGLDFDSHGRLIAAQMEGRIVRIDPATKAVTPLASTYDGARFNAPNDLTVDEEDGLYFSDARFRAPQPWPQKTEGVYYVSPSGTVTRVIDDIPAPNGVLLSADRKTLYVVSSLQPEVFRYDVLSPGTLGPRQEFATLRQHEQFRDVRPGADGLTGDRNGNLYVTSALGLQVFDRKGTVLGVLPFDEQTSNATFGGPDFRRLYVTARTSVYYLDLDGTVGSHGPGEDRR